MVMLKHGQRAPGRRRERAAQAPPAAHGAPSCCVERSDAHAAARVAKALQRTSADAAEAGGAGLSSRGGRVQASGRARRTAPAASSAPGDGAHARTQVADEPGPRPSRAQRQPLAAAAGRRT